MKISILNKHTDKSALGHYISQIKLFLYDMTCDYPFFGEWLNMAMSELTTGRREALVLTEEDKPRRLIGLTILKNDPEEKKICTIRVAPDYQRQGWGTALIKKSMEILGTDKPLITVSEKHIGVFKAFLKQFDFRVVNKVKSLYHVGEYEYFFNVPYLHRNVLISIKAQYVDKILSGEKKVEFRRKCFSKDVTRAYIYESAPVSAIIGYFEVAGIETDRPMAIWQKYYDIGGILESDFFKYANGPEFMSAIRIGKIHQFKTKIHLNDLKEYGMMSVPQNYCNIDNVGVIKKLNDIVAI